MAPAAWRSGKAGTNSYPTRFGKAVSEPTTCSANGLAEGGWPCAKRNVSNGRTLPGSIGSLKRTRTMEVVAAPVAGIWAGEGTSVTKHSGGVVTVDVQRANTTPGAVENAAGSPERSRTRMRIVLTEGTELARTSAACEEVMSRSPALGASAQLAVSNTNSTLN